MSRLVVSPRATSFVMIGLALVVIVLSVLVVWQVSVTRDQQVRLATQEAVNRQQQRQEEIARREVVRKCRQSKPDTEAFLNALADNFEQSAAAAEELLLTTSRGTELYRTRTALVERNRKLVRKIRRTFLPVDCTPGNPESL